MNLKSTLKSTYSLLAERSTQGFANRVGFRLFRDARVLSELLVPQRFFSKTVVVKRPSDGAFASFRSWGNESSLWYLRQCLQRSGLSIIDDEELPDEVPEPSIEFVWHNRALSSRFRRSGFLVAPGQVRSRVDLSEGMEMVRSRFLRSAKAAVRHNRERGLRYHIAQGEGNLTQFYEQMYLPYRQARFPGNPIVKEFDMLRDFASGSVMLVVTEASVGTFEHLDDALGALLIRSSGASATPDMPGISGDPAAALDRGVVEALYYFSLEWCFDQGVQSVDLGQSHPFLDDGILRFKTKWGARVEASQTGLHNLGVRFLDNGWLGKHFLEHHPLILERRVKRRASLVGISYIPPDELNYHNVRKLGRSRMIEGLSGLVAVSDPESTSEAENLASQVPDVRFLPCYDLRYLASALSMPRGMDVTQNSG
ncbi:MAG: hypothetical protein JW941_06365 [Candidatus Coatesbacteria bacterium]|nr:hypothetical protein [Candidatus Coatesbacteria bacterium]